MREWKESLLIGIKNISPKWNVRASAWKVKGLRCLENLVKFDWTFVRIVAELFLRRYMNLVQRQSEIINGLILAAIYNRTFKSVL